MVTNDFRQVLRDELNFLLFRPIRPDFDRLGNYYLAMGLCASWLAGMGRYYDNPNAYLFQYLGLGSVAYVFVMAALLYLILAPLRPANWTYRNVLIFVGMTAPPAILYATPIQWFLPFEAARLINIWFLVIVAIWRVALLFHYLMRSAQLGIAGSLIGGLLPLSLVVVILAMLNLQHVTFDIMAGVKTEGTTGMEATYSIILALTVLSFAIFPFSLLGYFYLIYRRRPDQPPA
jgi:hypothetical protein